MSPHNDNPPTSALLVGVTAVESLVLLVAGLGLLIFPSVIGPEWPWELTRFNALLLGTAYTSSMMATIMTVRARRWAPARVVMPMILLFTTVVLVVSLVYLERFDLGNYSTWIWFLLYVAIPANAAYYLWTTRHLAPHYPHSPETPWRSILLIPTILLGAYGLGLLMAPETLSAFWPWPIDGLHGRMYSVLFLTPAFGAVLLWRAAASVELLTTGLVLAVGGAIPIFGLWIVDRDLDKVDWSASGTWLWLGIFLFLLLVGLGMIRQSRYQEQKPNTGRG